MRAFALGCILLPVWFVWSGHTEVLLLSLGLVSCLLVLWLTRRMGIIDAESVPIERIPRLLLYLPWLVWQVVKSNLDVARRILDPRLPIRPLVLRVRAGQRDDLGRVIYANSITLTPGTVSIRVEDDEIEVHALTREAADGLLDDEMNRRVTRAMGDR
jgi:multicomponent Na+:H+ antiporter subunit E